MKRRAPPRRACEVGLREEGRDQLRVTGSAGTARRGQPVSITIAVENVGQAPVVLHLADPWRDAHPILVTAKDAQGRRVDRPKGRCDGPGARVEGVLDAITSFRAVVLAPGGKAHLATTWAAREPIYLRDVRPRRPDRAAQILSALSPCHIDHGKPLAVGHYELHYDTGLLVSSEARSVSIAVDLR